MTNIAWDWNLMLRNLQTKHYFVNKKKRKWVCGSHICVRTTYMYSSHLRIIKIPAFSTARKYDSAVSTWNWRKISDYFHDTYDELVVCCFSYFIYVPYKRRDDVRKDNHQDRSNIRSKIDRSDKRSKIDEIYKQAIQLVP